jgi:hypothetical protein
MPSRVAENSDSYQGMPSQAAEKLSIRIRVCLHGLRKNFRFVSGYAFTGCGKTPIRIRVCLHGLRKNSDSYQGMPFTGCGKTPNRIRVCLSRVAEKLRIVSGYAFTGCRKTPIRIRVCLPGLRKNSDSYQGMPSGIPQVAEIEIGFSRWGSMFVQQIRVFPQPLRACHKGHFFNDAFRR